MEEEFMKQFSGSASANVLTVLLLGGLMLLKKCIDKPSNYSHSKCTSCCLSVELDKDESSDEQVDLEREVQKKVENRVLELLGKHSDDLFAQHIPAVPAIRRDGREFALHKLLAKAKEVAEEARFPEIVSPARAVDSSNQGEPGIQRQKERVG